MRPERVRFPAPWHEHLMQCVNGRPTISEFPTSMPCRAKTSGTARYSAQMPHVWMVPNYPGGPFPDELSASAVPAATQQASAARH